MAGTIAARLDKLETDMLSPKPARMIPLVTTDEQ